MNGKVEIKIWDFNTYMSHPYFVAQMFPTQIINTMCASLYCLNLAHVIHVSEISTLRGQNKNGENIIGSKLEN